LIENVVGRAFAGELVTMLDQKPVGALSAIAIATHPNQYPASVQLLAIKREFEVALGKTALRVIAVPIAAVPQLHGATAILAFRNGALEVAVVERMVLHLDREPLVMRIERRTARHRPGLEDAVKLQAEIIMQPGCRMLLNHEAPPLRRSHFGLARRLCGLLEIALFPVSG